MKKILLIISFLICFGFILNNPKGTPTSQSIGARGEKTFILFNSANGAKINLSQNNFNESIIFKREFSNKEDVTNWKLDSISPTLITNDRDLAYKYYSDIPGVVWIEKTLFCDETEVSNLDWIEFLELSGYSKNHNHANPTMDKINYNSSPQFYYFPVVNISYEGALEYCKWRTKVVTENYNKQNQIDKSAKEYTIFNFRLPSMEEWIKCAAFATDTLKYPHLFTKKEIKTSINKKDIAFLKLLGTNVSEKEIDDFNKYIKMDLVFNCKRSKSNFLNFEIPYYIWDYPSNNFGLYNMMGNVSEMVSEKDVSMGGSYRNTYEECLINNTFKYNNPSDCLGFRSVCEISWPNK
jgi:hypothetical protein